jgi:hypothetical protein
MARLAPLVLTCLVAGGGALRPEAALAHDPRTTARKLSQALEVEGVGRFAFDYRGLHFNSEMFERARANPGFMNLLNTQVWGRMGRATLGFEVVSRGTKLAPGEYDFGINMTPAEEFSVVLWQGEEKKELRLDVERDPKAVPYLTIALMATAMPDTFVLEARCGPYRGTVELKAPSLAADHAHDAHAPAPSAGEEPPVIAAVQRFFDTMAACDVEGMRAVVEPEGRVFRLTSGPGDELVVSTSTFGEFLARLAPCQEKLHERMWDPQVRVHQGLATLWAPYDLWRGGTFSHCGVDAFDLVKTASGWKIAGGVYTVEPEGCAPSPLGPPPGAAATPRLK